MSAGILPGLIWGIVHGDTTTVRVENGRNEALNKEQEARWDAQNKAIDKSNQRVLAAANQKITSENADRGYVIVEDRTSGDVQRIPFKAVF